MTANAYVKLTDIQEASGNGDQSDIKSIDRLQMVSGWLRPSQRTVTRCPFPYREGPYKETDDNGSVSDAYFLGHLSSTPEDKDLNHQASADNRFWLSEHLITGLFNGAITGIVASVLRQHCASARRLMR